MEAIFSETGPIQRQLVVTLTPEEFRPFTESRLADIQKKASIKGFRQGKAPMPVIRKMYGKAIDEEAVEEAIQKTFADYAEKNDLHPFGMPMVVDMKPLDDGGLEYTIRYEVLPQFELGEYKGLKGRKVYHVVTPEELDQQIEWLRERHKIEEVVDSIGDESHTLVADFQKLDESGLPLIGQGSTNIPINMASDRINEELKTALLGKRLDDKVRISLPTGENEEEIPYEVTIKEIKQTILPELDETFARKITGEEDSDVEDMRDVVKQSIEAEYEQNFARLYRDELIDKLISAHDFEVPQALTIQILNSYIEDAKQQFQNKELPENFPMREFLDSRRPEAERIARWLLLRDKIVEVEAITVTDEDIEAVANIDAERMGMEPASVIEYYRNNDEITMRILTEKVLQLVSDYSEVEEEIDDEEWKRLNEEARQKAIAASNATATADEDDVTTDTDAEAVDGQEEIYDAEKEENAEEK